MRKFKYAYTGIACPVYRVETETRFFLLTEQERGGELWRQLEGRGHIFKKTFASWSQLGRTAPTWKRKRN